MLLCLGSNPSSLSANAESAGDNSNRTMQEESRAEDGILDAGRAFLDIWELNLPKTSVLTRKEDPNMKGLKKKMFSVGVWVRVDFRAQIGLCWEILADFRVPKECNGYRDPRALHSAIPWAGAAAKDVTKQGQGGGEFISGFNFCLSPSW